MSLKQLELIVNAVFKVDNLKKNTRKREVVDAKKSFSQLALHFSLENKRRIMMYIERDHALFSHYEKEVEYLLKSDKEFRDKYNSCKNIYETHGMPVNDNETLAEIYLKLYSYHIKEASKMSKKTEGCCIKKGCKKKGIAKLGMYCRFHYNQAYQMKEPLKVKFRQMKNSAQRAGLAFDLPYNSFLNFCKLSNYIELKEADPKILIKLKEKKHGYRFSNLCLKKNNVLI